MSIIAAIITFSLGISFFFKKRISKILILIIGCICFDCFRISEISVTQFKVFLCLCFFLSEIKYLKFYFSQIKNTVILKLIIVVIVGSIILIITSPHLNSIISIGSYISTDLIAKYFVIIYSFVAISKINDLSPIIKTTYKCLIILSCIGFFEFILERPIWLNLLEINNVSTVIYDGRLRLSSMFIYTFDYGQICVIISYILVFCFIKKKYLSKNQILIGFIGCLFGILMCGSRSVIICFILGLVCYSLTKYTITKNVKRLFLITTLVTILVIIIPQMRDKFDFILSSFDSNSEVSGSSIEMRITQYATVFMLVVASPIFGLGYNYFYMDLGWSSGLNVAEMPYPELAGLEGALMSIVLERGIVGVLVYIIFYVGLLWYANKIKGTDKDYSAVSIAIIISFVIYGNMTGELNSAMPTLLFSGIFLKLAYISKYYRKDGCISYNS